MLIALIRKEILALLRDPHALAALFLMPAAFIVVMSLALANLYAPPLATLPWAADAAEHSPAARRLLDTWRARHGPAAATPADVDDALRHGRIAYLLRIEPGFAAALAELDPPAAPVIGLQAESGLDPGLFRALQAELAAATGELRAAMLRDEDPEIDDDEDEED